MLSAIDPKPKASDPLTEVLKGVRIQGAHFYAVEASAPWSIEALAAQELLPRIMPMAEHLISYHIVTEGHCFAGLPGEEQAELRAGDVIVFPHGDAHLMSSAPGVRVDSGDFCYEQAGQPHRAMLGGGHSRDVSFVCGFLGCDRLSFNPLLRVLPRVIHMQGVSSVWLDDFTRRVAEESRLGRAGADGVLTRLAELMFVDVLRRYLESRPDTALIPLSGSGDDLVGRVLALLHGRPGHRWTLEDLSREVASSRSRVSARFARLVGQSPMRYLTRWRMQLAANLLLLSAAKVSSIGLEVGYDSEAAFNRAFKKAMGLAPGAWRAANGASGQPSRVLAGL